MVNADHGGEDRKTSGLERRYIYFSAVIIALGIAMWGVHWVLIIPVSRWRSLVGETAADLIGELNFLYQMILAPVFSLALIGCSVWLIVVGVKRFRGKMIVVLLPAAGILLPSLFLLYQIIGLVLLATMDF